MQAYTPVGYAQDVVSIVLRKVFATFPDSMSSRVIMVLDGIR